MGLPAKQLVLDRAGAVWFRATPSQQEEEVFERKRPLYRVPNLPDEKALSILLVKPKRPC